MEYKFGFEEENKVKIDHSWNFESLAVLNDSSNGFAVSNRPKAPLPKFRYLGLLARLLMTILHEKWAHKTWK